MTPRRAWKMHESAWKKSEKRVDALYANRQAELETERAERQAERELERAERQAVLNNLVQINNALTQLLAERQNGRSSPED